MSLYRGVLILSLLAHWAAAVPQVMMVSEMPDRNQSTIGFPKLPQDFKEMARKLMMKCSKKGYEVTFKMENLQNSSYTLRENRMAESPISLFPELLASVSPPYLPRSNLQINDTTDRQDPSQNMFEKMWNCTNMGHWIELMRNTTDNHRCFMHAFVAPLSWLAIMQNGTDLNNEDLIKLLWGAKPFLETMPPSTLTLPPFSQSAQLAEMMKMFGEVFMSLSEGQRNEIIGWVKERVAEIQFGCLLKPPVSSVITPKSKSGKPPAASIQNNKCQPKMPWLKAKEMTMMGPFLSRLSLDEAKTIPKEALCEFFGTPEFSSSFRNVGGIQPALGRTLLDRLKEECSSGDNFTQHMDRLGSLACFYDGAQSLNVVLSKKLLAQLDNCDNSGIDKVKRLLVQKILETNNASSQQVLKSLGAAVSVLSVSKLSHFTSEDLNNTLTSLSQAKWKPVQAKTLAKKLLEVAKNVTGEMLLSLGSVVRGVGSDLLKKVKAEGLLGNEALKTMSEKMSSLQRKALLEAFRRDVSASELVKEVPDSLLPSLSLSTLEKANLTSVDQLEGHGWTRAQSAFLLKKILGNKINLKELRMLGPAVQGVTCEMIERVNRSDALEIVQTLAKSSDWLSRVQIHCAAQKLFASLEEQRPRYFSDISDSELQAIPAILLIHLPMEKIQNLSDAVCPAFMEKMKEVNLSSLPNSAPSRSALTRRALSCLGANTSDLSAQDVLSLGPLVCELNPAWIASLNPAALNSTLQALASCKYIPQQHRDHLFRLLTDTYGDPSTWSEDDMKALGNLLLLNDTAIERLPFKSWLKSCLSDLMDSLPSQPMVSPPKEFRSWFDLSALRRKVFELKTTNTPLGRRKRAAETVPALLVIEDLGQGNLFWSPAQLKDMTLQTFKDAMPTLGEITNYSAEQLSVLKAKVLEAWSSVSMLNESQIAELGCISQSFSPEDLRNLSITSLDTLELLTVCNWTQTQREAVWQAFEKRTGVSVAGLGELEMVGLGQFICGLQPSQVDQLNSTKFREAAETVGRAPCTLNIRERLKDKAVTAFGKPESWSEAQVGILGNIIAGLNATELGHLNSLCFPFIQPSTIPLIPTDRLAALSVNQLKALGPDNAGMVTEAQRAGLSADQRLALDEAVGLRTSRADVSSGKPPTTLPLTGGAPAQSVAGWAVVMQVIMLMLLGYMC